MAKDKKTSEKKETKKQNKKQKEGNKEGNKQKKKNRNKNVPLHWADQMAARIIAQKGNKKSYTGASGITPSGTIHIGNFREIISTELVVRALRSSGKKVRFIYSWDDYDVFRKVPANMPKQEILKTFLRKPIVDTPDPYDKEESYARHNQVEVEKTLPKVGVNPEFIYQHKRYRKGTYAKEIIKALENTKKIKEILNKFRKEPLASDWLPVMIFSKKDGTDKIKNLRWDKKQKVTYTCEDGTEESCDVTKDGNIKLLWRIDWPMRWSYEKVDFEPGGKDHSTVGGSYDTAKDIVKIFDWSAPVYYQYNFISIKGKGGKISSSKGNVVTLQDCLDVYEPEIVRWLFASTRPNAEFAMSFDIDVIKIYEDFDKCERIHYGKQKVKNEKELANQKRIYELSMVEEGKVPKTMPFQPGFRHLTNILLQNELDIDKTIAYYKKDLKNKKDEKKLKARALCAMHWLENYAPEDFKYTVNKAVPKNLKLTKEQKNALHDLAKALGENDWGAKELHTRCYEIMKAHNLEGKDFFTACYKVLISKEKGPKLAAFLTEIKERAIKLLESV
jgi:lysyl-tRNA synthetase, class I